MKNLMNRSPFLLTALIVLSMVTGCVTSNEETCLADKTAPSSNAVAIVVSKEDQTATYLVEAEKAISERNYGIVMDLYKKADALGSPLARYKIGLAYFEGRIVEKDVNKGLKHIREAAVMGCVEASNFLRDRVSRVAKLLDANKRIKDSYGISIGQVVEKKDAIRWTVEEGIFDKYASEGRWITILPPRHPQEPDMKIHIHLDTKSDRIDGVRAYVPVKVNGKTRGAFTSVSDELLAPFEKIAGHKGEYYEATDSVVTKGLKLIDAANENWMKISYTTRYFGAHLELSAQGTCFAEFND